MSLDFLPVLEGWPDLLHGAIVTVEITAASLVLGCILGLLVGLGRLDRTKRLRYAICTAYVTFIRGTPLLVQLFLLFFGLPQFDILLPAFLCGVLGMGIYSGAYVSEIVRGAIQSIDKGQMEAARSLGMSSGKAMLTITDLMHEGQKIISVSYRSLEVYIAVALVYLVLTSLTSMALQRVEKHLRAGGAV